ncbi:hypothetical protein D0Z07_6223 [Hyphodiscus hymeniophilus]|uniref:Myb-like domain-containing protein n=1 Tax=Hyphodiscus hymeniophilus TaxID=353542 RepID=A0A9P6VFE5_9HELO|nr:hypothetical protein D0Z07_6223 [Hyphodiscus hymeniophilus]
MVINARPRYVSHGFETFVPFQRVESLHQNLVEMTNNDVNAWNFFRPVATPSNGWDENLEGFNNENFALHSLYPGYYQNTASVPQSQASNLQKAPLYSPAYQSRCNYNTASNTHSMHPGQVTALNCVEKRSPMLANGYSHGYLGQRHGSFAEFSNTRHGMKQFAYQNLNDSGHVPFAAASSSSSSSYQENIPMIGDASSSTTYSSYSTSSATIDPLSLIQVNAHNPQDASLKGMWWEEKSKDRQHQYQDSYGMALNHDGLPRDQRQHQQFSNVWITDADPPTGWTTQATASPATIAPITISPKALTLSVPAPSISSSESSQGLILPLSDSSPASSSASSSRQDTPEWIPETMQVIEPAPVRPHRQILPDSLPRSRADSIVPSNDYASRKSIRKLSAKAVSKSHSIGKPSPPTRSKLRLLFAPQKVGSSSANATLPKKIEPKPTAESSSSSSTAQATHRRNEKDDFLVKKKLAGMAYKDIRREGNFTEAESTLRGRFRTLTKHKTARVRKPEWTDNDLRLLKKAVRKLSNGSDIAKGKVPWKLVAEYIANNGGSYHFGNATCRRRWDELPPKQRS